MQYHVQNRAATISRHLISYELMQESAILRFDQCGAVARDCSSALLDAIQEKKTHTQHFRESTSELERCLDEYVNICCTVSSQ